MPLGHNMLQDMMPRTVREGELEQEVHGPLRLGNGSHVAEMKDVGFYYHEFEQSLGTAALKASRSATASTDQGQKDQWQRHWFLTEVSQISLHAR